MYALGSPRPEPHTQQERRRAGPKGPARQHQALMSRGGSSSSSASRPGFDTLRLSRLPSAVPCRCNCQSCSARKPKALFVISRVEFLIFMDRKKLSMCECSGRGVRRSRKSTANISRKRPFRSWRTERPELGATLGGIKVEQSVATKIPAGRSPIQRSSQVGWRHPFTRVRGPQGARAMHARPCRNESPAPSPTMNTRRQRHPKAVR